MASVLMIARIKKLIEKTCVDTSLALVKAENTPANWGRSPSYLLAERIATALEEADGHA